MTMLVINDPRSDVSPFLGAIFKGQYKVVLAPTHDPIAEADLIVINGRLQNSRGLLERLSTEEQTKNVPIIFLVDKNDKVEETSADQSNLRYLSIDQGLMALKNAVSELSQPAKP